MDIDFVITWVDGADSVWKKEKENYIPEDENDDSDGRYRDWDLLRFWLRGVEKYAGWVRKIHFITWGHVPKWLVEEHPKLHIVLHEDYLPKEILPTYNSCVLELFLHKIPGLAKHFVYFNDDMFLTKNVRPEDFFKDGLPCDMLAFQPVVANAGNPLMSRVYMNHSIVLAKHFDKRSNVKAHMKNYFKIGYPILHFFYNALELCFPRYTGFYTVHGPSAFLKQTYEDVWEKEHDLLMKIAHNRFRSNTDVSQYLFREWQKLSGNFKPKNVEKQLAYFEIGQDNHKIVEAIEKQKKKVICINDTGAAVDEDCVRKQLVNSFEKILGETSSFEKA